MLYEISKTPSDCGTIMITIRLMYFGSSDTTDTVTAKANE